MSAANGKTVSGGAIASRVAPDPREPVARTVIAALQAEGSDEDGWEELTEQEQESERFIAGEYIAAHVAFLGANGLRILPVNAVPVPRSEQEAVAMVQAAQRFLDGRKRKSKLIGGGPRKLILPGAH